jgi:hypothetical protein
MADPSTVTKIILSSQGLHSIPPDRYENDFKFYIGTAEYGCPSFLADFLSPRISQLRISDPTLSAFTIDIPDPSNEFESFLALGRGSDVTITSSNASFLFTIASNLANLELCDLIDSNINTGLNSKTALTRLLFRGDLGLDCETEKEFVASHFHEFSMDEVSKLPYPMIYDILTHPSLALESEDALWKFVYMKICDDIEYIALLEFVSFEHLSPESFAQFTDLLANNFDHFTLQLWNALSGRLVLPVVVQNRSRRVLASEYTCPFQFNAPLEGIIAHLTRKCGGNVHDKQMVDVTSSSVYRTDPKFAAKNIADLKAKSAFTSSQLPDQWVCYDFKPHSVLPTHYSVRSFDGRPHSEHPKEWVLEGSEDGVTWIILDQQEKNFLLDGRDRIGSFQIAEPRLVHMIRFRQIGPNHLGNDYLIISALEIFGSITFADD